MLPLQLLFLAAACMSHSTSVAAFCDKEMAKQAWVVCSNTYQLNHVVIKDMCRNLECILQCFVDAFGDCQGSDTFLDEAQHYDIEMYKVYYRATCSDVKMATKLLGDRNICPSNQICSQEDSASNVDSNLLDLYKAGKYEDYKKLLCSKLRKRRSCVSVRQSENCSAASARFYENILKIGSSVSICENTDIQHLYTAFGGDVKCVNPKVLDIVTAMSTMECDIKCYEEAVGDCYKRSENLMMEPMPIKVVYRAVCDRKEELIAALKGCELRDKTCSTEIARAMSKADDLIVQQDYEAYRQTVCSATSQIYNCMKYVATENCTNEMASLLEDIANVGYNFAGCGTQNHAFFSKYGYDTECDVSSDGNALTNTLLIIIFMFLFVLFHD